MFELPTGENAPAASQLVNVSEAAQALRVSIRQVWRLAGRGGLPMIGFGRSTRSDARDLARFIDANRRTSARRAR